MKRYAVAQPGKVGDAIYTLPAIQEVCVRDDAVVDFYTSVVGAPLKKLMLNQPGINDFIVLQEPEYVIESFGQGVQPWHMPVPEDKYDKVYQLGFEHFPRGPLTYYHGMRMGINRGPFGLRPEYSYEPVSFFDEPYIVVCYTAHRGSTAPELYHSYKHVIENCPIKVVQTGIQEDWVDAPSEDFRGRDLYEVLSLLANAEAYLGMYSGTLALANGFASTLPRIITMTAPSAGEQHGLHLENEMELLVPDGPKLLQGLEWALERRKEICHLKT